MTSQRDEDFAGKPDPKREEVRRAIQKAVPEIMEPKLGCRVIEELSNKLFVVIGRYIRAKSTLYIVMNPENGAIHESPLMSHQVLGCPIMLDDVLRALLIKYDEPQYITMRRSQVTEVPCLWHFPGSLDDQSDELISFLHSILV